MLRLRRLRLRTVGHKPPRETLRTVGAKPPSPTVSVEPPLSKTVGAKPLLQSKDSRPKAAILRVNLRRKAILAATDSRREAAVFRRSNRPDHPQQYSIILFFQPNAYVTASRPCDTNYPGLKGPAIVSYSVRVVQIDFL